MSTEQKTPQIRAIAEAAGVSTGTVSIVLNGRGDELRISKATQEKVRAVAEKLNYTPNMTARRLRQSGENNPELIIAEFVNIDIMRTMSGEYLAKLLAEMFLALQEKEIRAEIVLQPFFPGKLCDLREQLNQNRYSGIIINSATDIDIEFLKDNDFDVPIVVINRDTGGKYMSIRVNDYDGGKKCAEIFAKNGHKRAAIIGIRESSFAMRMRKMGFIDGCRQFGIEICDEWTISTDELSHDAGYRIMDGLLTVSNGPTAFLVMSDNLSLGALSACTNRGVRVPQDAEIIVHGISSAYDYCSPSLTSFTVSNREVAQGSLDLLLLAMKDKKLVVNISIFVHFIFRDSCRQSG